MPAPQFDRLTDGQKQSLRLLWHERLRIADVAFRLGIAEDTVDQRLRAARRHLGVGSSMEAARLLAEYEEGGDVSRPILTVEMGTAAMSPSPVYPSSDIPEPSAPAPLGANRAEAGADKWRWPLPRWNGEENNLGIGQRLFWVFAIMAASIVSLMLALTMAESLTRLIRMLR